MKKLLIAVGIAGVIAAAWFRYRSFRAHQDPSLFHLRTAITHANRAIQLTGREGSGHELRQLDPEFHRFFTLALQEAQQVDAAELSPYHPDLADRFTNQFVAGLTLLRNSYASDPPPTDDRFAGINGWALLTERATWHSEHADELGLGVVTEVPVW